MSTKDKIKITPSRKSAISTEVQIKAEAGNLTSLHNMIAGFRTVLDQTGSYIFMKDMTGRYTYVNQMVQDLFAQSYENIIGKDDSHFFDLELANELQFNDRLVLDFGKTIEREEEAIVKLTGEIRNYWVIKKPLLDSQGQIIGMCGISKDITDRKHADQALRQSETRFTALFNNMTNGFALHEVVRDDVGNVVDYQFLDINPAFEKITGIPRESWIGKCVKEVLPNTEEYWIKNYGEVATTGKPRSFENYSNEIGRWYHIYAYKPAPEQFAVIAEDITDRKNLERALQESERRCSEILESVDAYIFLKDTQGRYLFVTSKVCKLFGVAQEEVIGQSDARFFDAEANVKISIDDRLVLDEGKTIRTEETIKLKMGEASTYLVDKLPLRNEKGEIYALCGIATDITKRKLVENALQIAAIAFETKEGIMVTDANNIILRVNHSFTRITGYSAEQAVGQTPRLLRSGHHNTDFYAAMWKTINTTGSWDGEVWNRRKNGGVYPEHLTITAVTDDYGLLTNYVATLTDSTETKLLEQQRIAEESSHRDALVREVHHRIKNNLQGVTGVLRNFATQHPESAVPMAAAISQVQSIAIIHGLQGRTLSAKVRLCELTSEIAANNQSLWNTAISVDIPPNWIPCLIAETEAVPIALVLNELISNALKHGGLAKGINISLRHEPQPNMVQVTITNPGHLPADFDFSKSSVTGTGLLLVSSLLPKKGASLSFESIDEVVSVRLELGPTTISLEKKEIKQL
jgi:PAS domain S-box-containing protein